MSPLSSSILATQFCHPGYCLWLAYCLWCLSWPQYFRQRLTPRETLPWPPFSIPTQQPTWHYGTTVSTPKETCVVCIECTGIQPAGTTPMPQCSRPRIPFHTHLTPTNKPPIPILVLDLPAHTQDDLMAVQGPPTR